MWSSAAFLPKIEKEKEGGKVEAQCGDTEAPAAAGTTFHLNSVLCLSAWILPSWYREIKIKYSKLV